MSRRSQTQPRSTENDAIPDDKLIEWPIDASSEWIAENFGERADVFVRQVAELPAERKIQELNRSREAQ